MGSRFTHEMLGNWANDFCQSDAMSLFPGAVAHHAATILTTLLQAACALRDVGPEQLEEGDIKHALLTAVAKVALEEEARAFIPSLCRAFLEDLQRQGRIGNGRTLGRFVGALKQAFLEASSAKPSTFQRPGAKIGRNDPCPCGSGKKYKKCCWREDA